MAGKPIKIESWENSEGEFCNRFSLRIGKHPLSVVYGLHKKFAKKHPDFEFKSLVRVDALSENGRTLWVARWARCTS